MNELIVVEPTNITTVFTAEKGLDPYLARIEQEAKSFIPDTTTAKGRDQIRSMAAKVASSKTYLDGLGKELVADLKELPKKIDSERKRMRDFLDALRDEVRQPLTDYEMEQERIKAEKEAEEAAKKLSEQIDRDWELADLMNKDFDRQKEEAERKRAQDQAEREERIRQEAEERARKESQLREDAAKFAALRAEEAQKAAEERARQAQEEAEERARLAAERAVEEEKRKREAEELNRKKKEEARAADVEHRRKVNREAVNAFVAFIPSLSEDDAMSVVKAIASGLIDGVSINY